MDLQTLLVVLAVVAALAYLLRAGSASGCHQAPEGTCGGCPAGKCH